MVEVMTAGVTNRVDVHCSACTSLRELYLMKLQIGCTHWAILRYICFLRGEICIFRCKWTSSTHFIHIHIYFISASVATVSSWSYLEVQKMTIQTYFSEDVRLKSSLPLSLFFNFFSKWGKRSRLRKTNKQKKIFSAVETLMLLPTPAFPKAGRWSWQEPLGGGRRPSTPRSWLQEPLVFVQVLICEKPISPTAGLSRRGRGASAETRWSVRTSGEAAGWRHTLLGKAKQAGLCVAECVFVLPSSVARWKYSSIIIAPAA